jgi:hypothetical protein
MRTLLAALCVTLVFAAAAAAGTATNRSNGQNLASALAPKVTLSVSNAGKGTGWVTSAPAGISCGTVCSGNFAVGTTVTLTAQPAVGSTFGGYSGTCTPVAPPKLSGGPSCKVTLNGDTSVQATFNVTPEPCFVPNLKGRLLANAKQKLLQDACRPGKITRAFSSKVKKGRVLSQNPGAGWQRLHGAVNLIVSKGSH